MNNPTLGDEGLAVPELEDATPSRLALTWLLHRSDAVLTHRALQVPAAERDRRRALRRGVDACYQP